jgi:hypothetical protein
MQIERFPFDARICAIQNTGGGAKDDSLVYKLF